MRMGQFRVWSVGIPDDAEMVFLDRHADQTNLPEGEYDDYGGCPTGTFTPLDASHLRFTNDTVCIDPPMPE